MDKKPGEELASTLDANPSEPITPAPAAAPAPAPTPVAEPAPAPVVAAPTAGAAAPVKKKKTGLIVGVTVGALALIGGGTAAAIILLNNNKGPENVEEVLSESISSMLSGETNSIISNNTAFDGVLSIEGAALGGSVNVNLSGETDGKVGKANIGVSANISGMDLSANLDAIVNDSTLYARLNGVKDLLENEYLSLMLSQYKSLKSIDGVWYKMPIKSATNFKFTPTTSYGASSKCDVDAEELIEDREGLGEIYKANSFIIATKYTGSDIAKKKSDLYELSIDADKLNDFIEAVSEKYVSNSKCKAATVDSSALDSLKNSGLKVYAEFENKGISRLYSTLSNAEMPVTFKLDLSISHPDSINIDAPSGAKSYEELVEKIAPLFGGSYGGSYGGYTDNCLKGGYSTNCINYDDDDDYSYDDDDDDDWTSSYSDDFDMSELEAALEQLGGYESLLEGLDLDDYDFSDYDSSELESALETLKNLQ